MKKNKIKKVISLGLSVAMVLGITGCEREAADSAANAVITQENQEDALTEILNGQVSTSHSSEAGKEETVYVLADANGTVNQVIVSDWLKNADGGETLLDSSDLTDIENVKGYEGFETDQDGNMLWQADGSDIYYQGTSDKEVPVEVKLSYQLDGKAVTPEELAGKSGKVTIRMDYENKETRKVMIGDKEEEIKVPFAMISGMVLPQDTFSNIEVTNAKLMSEGENSIVVGMAFPGLKESIDLEGMKDKISDDNAAEEIEDMEIPEYIEVTADVRNFKLDMTMTLAMSDILSDIELTDSFDFSDLTDSMEELEDAANQLKDGTAELKDGSGQLKDGTEELLAGTTQLSEGALTLKDGTQELYEKSGLLNDGAGQLDDGAKALYNGTISLQDGASKLKDGTESLVNGAESLNDGALLVKGGVDQVAAQMNMLKAGIGTKVTQADSLDPQNPTTLLEVSYLLNQTLKQMSSAAGLADEYYNAILASLQQQKTEAQENLETAQGNLEAAQNRSLEAKAELEAACQASSAEVEVVTGTHTETESMEVEVTAPVYTTTKVMQSGEEDTEEVIEENTDITTQTVTQTVDVEKEVVDTDTVQVQSVDVAELQQKVEAYQNSLQEVAAYQAEVTAYTMQITSIDEELVAAGDPAAQAALVQQWGPVITYGAVLEQKLEEISAALNAQESTQGMAALVKGVGDLAKGTQTALNGAKELSSGAGELSNGAGSLKDGAAALADGTGELKSGTEQLVSGTGTLNDGAGTLQEGIDALNEGMITLDSGVSTLDEGALALLDGMFEFDEEGISKLTELFGDDVQNVIDRLKAVADAGKDYNNFTGLPDGVDGSVKFIIRTEAVKEEK